LLQFALKISTPLAPSVVIIIDFFFYSLPFLFLFICVFFFFFLQFLAATIAGGLGNKFGQLQVRAGVCCSRLLAAYTPAAAHSKRCKWKWVPSCIYIFFPLSLSLLLFLISILPFLRGCVTHTRAWTIACSISLSLSFALCDRCHSSVRLFAHYQPSVANGLSNKQIDELFEISISFVCRRVRNLGEYWRIPGFNLITEQTQVTPNRNLEWLVTLCVVVCCCCWFPICMHVPVSCARCLYLSSIELFFCFFLFVGCDYLIPSVFVETGSFGTSRFS